MKEIEIENELLATISSGSEEAANALENILGGQVKSSSPTVEFFDSPAFQHLQKISHVFVTEIIGELQGKSYLVFSDKEVDIVYDLFMRKGIIKPNPELKIELLKEIDNIVSATIITQLSNHFDLSIYGNIPFHFEGKSNEIEHFISEDIQNSFSEGYLSKVFTSINFFNQKESLHLSPKFYWIFSGDWQEFSNNL